MKSVKSSYNAEYLQQILDCFTELTGIRVAYFHDAGEVITGKRKEICLFCKEIRNLPDIFKGCMASDARALQEAQNTRSLYLYKCHMGMWEAVVPLFKHDSYTGFLMLGQV